MQIVIDDMDAEHYIKALSGLLHTVVTVTTQPREQPGQESPPEPEEATGIVYVIGPVGLGLFVGVTTILRGQIIGVHRSAREHKHEVFMVPWVEIDTIEVLTTPHVDTTEWTQWTGTLSPGAQGFMTSMNEGLEQAQGRKAGRIADVLRDGVFERGAHPAGSGPGRLPEAFREHDDIDADSTGDRPAEDTAFRPEQALVDLPMEPRADRPDPTRRIIESDPPVDPADAQFERDGEPVRRQAGKLGRRPLGDRKLGLSEVWGPKDTGTPPPPVEPSGGLPLMDTESDYRGLDPQAGENPGDEGSTMHDALRRVGRDDGRPRAWIDSPVARAMGEHDVIATAEHLFTDRSLYEGTWTPPSGPPEPEPWPTNAEGMFIADRRNVGHPPYRLRDQPRTATGVTEAVAHALGGEVLHARETVTVEQTHTVTEGQATYDEVARSYLAVSDDFLPSHRSPSDVEPHVVRAFDDTSTM